MGLPPSITANMWLVVVLWTKPLDTAADDAATVGMAVVDVDARRGSRDVGIVGSGCWLPKISSRTRDSGEPVIWNYNQTITIFNHCNIYI